MLKETKQMSSLSTLDGDFSLLEWWGDRFQFLYCFSQRSWVPIKHQFIFILNSVLAKLYNCIIKEKLVLVILYELKKKKNY